MQAVILAAGMGKRLKELTNDCTKCMVRVNGVTMIERMLIQLDRLDLSQIVIVIGYKADKLIDFVSALKVHTPVIYVSNNIYYRTNNIYSLYLARNYLLQEDTLLLESDLIFEDAVLQKLLDDPYPSLVLVAKYESWMNGTVVTLDEHSSIRSFTDTKSLDFSGIENYYKTVNIYKFSQSFSTTHYVPFLEAYCKALGSSEYYEQVLKVITLLDKPEIKALALENESWYEIDDIQDLDIAESIFAASAEDKLEKFRNRYGGYWRYPRLSDFCYLANPFYPPAKLRDEIRANFDRLISDYPSGIDVNSMLAARYFGLHTDHVCVGNGAAELIKSLLSELNGKTGLILPTFEEYPARLKPDAIEAFYPDNQDYSYTAGDLINYFSARPISNLLLINPDNPSGNYIERKEVLRLARWAEEKGIVLIVDESFVDFAGTNEPPTLLDEEILRDHQNLIIIRSISKSFGVPGLRLGVLAAGNTEMISLLKKDAAIWNINSLAEFFLQIFEKYKGEYKEAMELFKKVRKEYVEKLGSIKALRVVPTQANFVLCELTGVHNAKETAEILLNDYDILIRDLSDKKGFTGQFIRVAVKRPEENQRLVTALQEILG
ncbi:MAG TPA: aminotransferase class I/II-fold pyridoxal phosphate-dependent enzyme [Syntrophomonadaceae bacterium]|nr:aminotransferase class I/II-fold pyridoxal phosphate-dependent enzyme [Syntrophomonadaceae bacterium]HPR94206.1 aminotransferase class I/II-fold pyridoxal phosphate-dependent enzyme [Syntrophomonadaceae bacterium]